MKIVKKEYQRSLKQIGTLGGGNHFIEIQTDSEGFVWIMIHSGSRNLGKKVADYYNQIAKTKKSPVPKTWQLDYLKADSKEGKSYLAEMNFCINFALANRKLMMQRVAEIFTEKAGTKIDISSMINIAHNYASYEKHFNNYYWIHRKGATKAKKGQIGIIPGSQGTKSYIVKGKGNPQSFESCSHGSGRKMGRKEAQRQLSMEKEIKHLEDKGVMHSIRGIWDLDEAPGAYKNIKEVMQDQEDLVEIVSELKPLAVIKG